MGYAIVMFGVLLVMSLVVVTAYNYGIAKESQIAPLKAVNIYAERETGKVQTGLTIYSTCLSGTSRYVDARGTVSDTGPHMLYLIVRNNGSIVLNPNNATVLYNASYINFTAYRDDNYDEHWHWEEHWHWDEYWEDFWEDLCGDDDDEEDRIFFRAWAPLTYACMKASNIYIYNDIPPEGPKLRLLVTAENGISTIAPTSPTNFTGFRTPGNETYSFRWNASYDEDGIAYYRLYAIESGGDTGECPPETYAINEIPGNTNSLTFDYTIAPGGNPNTDYFFITAVDTLQNEGVQSRTLKCQPAPNKQCEY